MAAAAASTSSARPRGIARREALLEAALRIVAEVGAEAVTHRRVAEVAGLPLASTTYWFDSKDHLLTAALELAAARDTERLRAFAAGAEADTAADADADAGGRDPLSAAVEAIVEPVDGGSQQARGSLIAAFALLLEAARRPAMRDVSRAWTEAYLDVVGALLARAGSRRPRQDAELLVAAADGLMIEQLAAGGPGDLRPRLLRVARALVGAP